MCPFFVSVPWLASCICPSLFLFPVLFATVLQGGRKYVENADHVSSSPCCIMCTVLSVGRTRFVGMTGENRHEEWITAFVHCSRERRSQISTLNERSPCGRMRWAPITRTGRCPARSAVELGACLRKAANHWYIPLVWNEAWLKLPARKYIFKRPEPR